MSDAPIIVSACLLGVKCRFDGNDALNKELAESAGLNPLFIPVCPEQLAGLATPRAKAEIPRGTGTDVISGHAAVVDSNGTDLTERFIAGAKETLRIAKLTGAKEAILKENSPSCGVAFIKRNGLKVPGPGVTTALLIKNSIKIEGR